MRILFYLKVYVIVMLTGRINGLGYKYSQKLSLLTVISLVGWYFSVNDFVKTTFLNGLYLRIKPQNIIIFYEYNPKILYFQIKYQHHQIILFELYFI
jgi:hypothetical protein